MTPAVISTIVLAGLVLLLILWFIAAYNGLIRRRNQVQESWAQIDVQLKRRHDLIPNLVKTVKAYADFERSVLNDVTRLRTRAIDDQTVGDKQRNENALSGALRSLFAVAENYPDLKANTNFLELQQQLSEIEDVLQKSRRYYNGTVRNYNTRVQTIPSNLVAGLFGFGNEEFFEMDNETERAVPDATLKDRQ